MTTAYRVETFTPATTTGTVLDEPPPTGRAGLIAGLVLMGTASAILPTSAATIASDASWTPIVVTTPYLGPVSRTLATSLRELKTRSGLTWQQIALSIGVSRRSLHYWMNGGNIAPSHEARLAAVIRTVDAVDAGSPGATREALTLADTGGRSILSRLIAEAQPSHGVAATEGGLRQEEYDASYNRGRVASRSSIDLRLKPL